jgi:hypothetical protein
MRLRIFLGDDVNKNEFSGIKGRFTHFSFFLNTHVAVSTGEDIADCEEGSKYYLFLSHLDQA